MAILLLAACKKEPQTQTATITTYSLCTPYSFSWSDKDGDHTQTITSQSFSKTFEVTEDQLDNNMGATKIGTVFPDSIHVHATIDGKTVDAETVVNCACSATAMILLNQAQ